MAILQSASRMIPARPVVAVTVLGQSAISLAGVRLPAVKPESPFAPKIERLVEWSG